MQERLENSTAAELIHYKGKKKEMWQVRDHLAKMIKADPTLIIDENGLPMSDELNPMLQKYLSRIEAEQAAEKLMKELEDQKRLENQRKIKEASDNMRAIEQLAFP